MNSLTPATLLAFIALLSFAIERSVSQFSWSRLEEMNPPRPRRTVIEQYLQERELVTTSFLVIGCAAIAGLACALVPCLPPTVWTVLKVVLLVVVISWIVPDLIARRGRDVLVVYILPLIYPMVRVPFRALRLLFREQSVAGARAAAARPEPGAEQTGTAQDAEAHEVFRMVVRLKHIQVREIMTPRTEMVTVSETATLREAAKIILESGYTRLPVYSGNPDHVIGVLHAKDLLQYAATEKWDQAFLREFMRQPFFVPETKSVAESMEEIKRSNVHMGIVLDEYGGTSGVVTLEDIIEEILGDIHDEHETPQGEPPLFAWIDERHVDVAAVMRVTEFNEEFGATLPDTEDFGTVGGYVTFVMGRIPAKGETLEFPEGRMTVLEADARRVIRACVEFDEKRQPVDAARTGDPSNRAGD